LISSFLIFRFRFGYNLINAGSEAAPLAAGETVCPVQADILGVQVIAGAHTPVPFRRVPTCHSRWPPGAAFRGCHHLPRTTHPD